MVIVGSRAFKDISSDTFGEPTLVTTLYTDIC